MNNLVEWFKKKLFIAGVIDGPDPVEGDCFAKVTSFLPPKRWPVWRVMSVHNDGNGIPTAILADLKQERSQRPIALDQLRNREDWQPSAK
jgi:hypothetical protein